ncbi:hypothetical protein Tco_0729761 [Tanacetum coccineum]|uniref:Uncharacterized protein n=1 Tax=Tanacetum coccineum TaxID=301880 RepID=A0ABQ4YQS7_9ASTR
MDTIPHRLADVMAFLIPISKGHSVFSMVSRILLADTSYYLWFERNSRLFKKKSSVVAQIIEVVTSIVPPVELERYLQSVPKVVDVVMIPSVLCGEGGEASFFVVVKYGNKSISKMLTRIHIKFQNGKKASSGYGQTKDNISCHHVIALRLGYQGSLESCAANLDNMNYDIFEKENDEYRNIKGKLKIDNINYELGCQKINNVSQLETNNDVLPCYDALCLDNNLGTNMYLVSKKGKSIMSSFESVHGYFGGDVGIDLYGFCGRLEDGGVGGFIGPHCVDNVSSVGLDSVGRGIILDFQKSSVCLVSGKLAASNNWGRFPSAVMDGFFSDDTYDCLFRQTRSIQTKGSPDESLLKSLEKKEMQPPETSSEATSNTLKRQIFLDDMAAQNKVKKDRWENSTLQQQQPKQNFSRIRSGGGFVLLEGKSSGLFKNGIWLAFGGVRDKARVVVRVVGMRLFSWSGDDSLDDMSMMLVLATFLGGFLVEEEALEAIFGDEQRSFCLYFKGETVLSGWVDPSICPCPVDIIPGLLRTRNQMEDLMEISEERANFKEHRANTQETMANMEQMRANLEHERTNREHDRANRTRTYLILS